jgi:hypothetical protein
MGRILFLSAVAFLAFRYINRSNSKVRQISQTGPGTVEILPPAAAERDHATVALPPAKTPRALSPAVETDLERR